MTGNVILRYPLDIKFPGFHLAPYKFGGIAGLFNQNKRSPDGYFWVAQEMKSERYNNKVLGDGGVGLEYRFTPHIGLFSDVRYNLVNESKNNSLSTRFGFRYAF